MGPQTEEPVMVITSDPRESEPTPQENKDPQKAAPTRELVGANMITQQPQTDVPADNQGTLGYGANYGGNHGPQQA